MSLKPEFSAAGMDFTDLLRELRELRERVDDFPIREAPTSSLPKVVIEKDPASPKTKLKPTKLPTYNGDRSLYPAWRRAVLSALKIDWKTFEYTNSRVFLMIYKALEGKALKQASPFFESGGVDGKERPEDFIEFLDRGNWDQTRVARARSELNEMKMGPRQRWSTFYSQWVNKLTEALGDKWPDETKVSLLKSALNQTLRVALAGNHLVPDDDFYEFSRIVGRIAHQYEEIPKFNGLNGKLDIIDQGYRKNNAGENTEVEYEDKSNSNICRSGAEYGPSGSQDSGGDTFMGGINAASTLKGPNGKPIRAKWKSPEKIKYLREQGRCFRCERKGCNTKICKLLPAVNPKPKIFKAPKVNNVTLEELDPELYEEFEEPSEN